VFAVGKEVKGFAQGDRVAVASGTSCGRCDNCQRGFDGHCGGQAGGAYSSGVTRDGSLAEYFVVPAAERNLARIPENVEDIAAVCATDTLSSGMTGPEAARIPLGGTVAVFGQGNIGLGATAGARALGAGLVVAVRKSATQDNIGTVMGADICLNYEEHDVQAEIHRLTRGAGVDCAIEASGASSSFPQAIEATRLGGTVVVLSSYSGTPGAALEIPLEQWGWGIGDKRILSTFAWTGAERLERLLRLISMGRIDPRPLVTHRYDFDDILLAFSDLGRRNSDMIKPVILFP